MLCGGGGIYQHYPAYKVVIYQMLPAELTGLSFTIRSQFPDKGRVNRVGIKEGNLRQRLRTIAGMTKPPCIKENIHIYTSTIHIQTQ
jgi:hypothetical protein